MSKPTEFVLSREEVGEARNAIGGFLWIGDNLHNSHTELFKEMYRSAIEDARPVYDAFDAWLKTEVE